MDIDIFQLPGILKRRWHYVALSMVICVIAALLYVLQLKPIYSSSTELLLDPQGLLAESSDSSQSGPASAVDQSSLDSQIFVVQSSTILDEVIEKLDLLEDPFFGAPVIGDKLSRADALASVAAGLKANMKVERAGQSFIMTITVDHANSRKAADIANAIATVYLKQVDVARSEAAKRASNAFQVQASELRDRVLKTELAVEKFKSDNGLASTGDKGLVIDQQLQGINDQLIEARGVEEQQQTIYEQTKKLTMAAVEAGAIPEALQSTSIGLLRDRYVQLLDRQTQMSTSLGSNHPQLKAIRSQVSNMQQAIQQELDRVRQAMQTNYERAAANTKALSERLENMTRTSFDSSAAQIKMRQLESEAEAVRTIYKAFLSRAEELSQRQTISINNSRVITGAVASPKSLTTLKLLILMAAGLFGTALGSGLAVLRELLGGRRITEKQQDDRAAALPTLATVPSRLEPTAKGMPRLPKLFGRDRVDETSLAERREKAIAGVAGLLFDALDRDSRATVAFVSNGPIREAADVIADIVQSLVDHGRDVFYAPGDLRESTIGRNPRSARPSLSLALAQEETLDAPLSDVLKYDQLIARAPQAQTPSGSRPTYSRFVSRGSDHLAGFVVINACGTRAAGHLNELLPQCDAIILLTEADAASGPQTGGMATMLEPWRDRMLGRIVMGDGA
ncbi:GumC family protein [Agrobacterium sp. a22-2]|uniref:GumC family protein n=1 Tax=Agrobacterium sp. a22-2 TaxID=2283840 RepID=UPI0014463DD6|nr:GumC family protein [Agrobacterium sp. a22-2]NKN39206.1 GumC family protein [Agrobacterium sp. a22-2]